MKDYKHVLKNFGRVSVKRINDIVLACGLSDVAVIESNFLGNFCRFTVSANDLRISAFFDELIINKISNKAVVKFEREFESVDFDIAELFTFYIARNPLCNPVTSQPYNRSRTCSVCGSGLEIIPPLILPRNEIGKSTLNLTGHNLWMVVERNLSEQLKHAGLTGIEFLDATLGREKEKYSFAHTHNILPRLSEKSSYQKRLKNCPGCNKSGNFDWTEQLNELVYDRDVLSKANVMDFNRTYEYFGEWDYTKLGGAQRIIISQKTRQTLIKLKVPAIHFTPVWIR